MSKKQKCAWTAVAAVGAAVLVGLTVWLAVAAKEPAWAIGCGIASFIVVYTAAQALKIYVFRWGRANTAEGDDIMTRLSMELVAMVDRAADIGRSPTAPTLATCLLADDRVRTWRQKCASCGGNRIPDRGPLSVEALAAAHAELSQLVAPATPQALRFGKYMRDNPVMPFLGQVQLVRQMMLIALVGLFMVLWFIPSADFSVSNGHDWPNTAVVVGASALGGAFYALTTSGKYIKARTFDPALQATYWSRFVLALVAGGLLAMLIPIGKSGSANAGGFESVFTKPVLALLGGYSAEVVRQMLDRLVETLKTLVQGRADAEVAVDAEENAARIQRLRIADQSQALLSVVNLQNSLGSSIPDAAQEQLDALYASLGGTSPPVTGAANDQTAPKNQKVPAVQTGSGRWVRSWIRSWISGRGGP